MDITGTTIEIEDRGSYWYVKIVGDIDVYTSPRIKKALIEKGLYESQKPVVLEISQVRYIDNTGNGVLIGFLKTLRAISPYKKPVYVVTNNPHIRRMFYITGLEKIFALSVSLVAAIEDITASAVN